MAILSEGKGVMMWLVNRGNNEQFASYLLKVFNEQTKISFHRITYTACDRTNFQRFTTWYGLQNIPELKSQYAVYKSQKDADKKKLIDKYLQSDLHKFFLENSDKERNELFKLVKNKMNFGKFKSCYKMSFGKSIYQ